MWLRPNRFAVGALVAALGFLVTINLMNPDADVAAYNLKRQDELSTRYLYLLSELPLSDIAAAFEVDVPKARRLVERGSGVAPVTSGGGELDLALDEADAGQRGGGRGQGGSGPGGGCGEDQRGERELK